MVLSGVQVGSALPAHSLAAHTMLHTGGPEDGVTHTPLAQSRPPLGQGWPRAPVPRRPEVQ